MDESAQSESLEQGVVAQDNRPVAQDNTTCSPGQHVLLKQESTNTIINPLSLSPLAEGSPKSPSVPAPPPAYGRGYEPAPTAGEAEDVGVEREREEAMNGVVGVVEDTDCVGCGRSADNGVCDDCEEEMVIGANHG